MLGKGPCGKRALPYGPRARSARRSWFLCRERGERLPPPGMSVSEQEWTPGAHVVDVFAALDIGHPAASADAMNGGRTPTFRNARTGELTPPGMYLWASRTESGYDSCRSRSLASHIDDAGRLLKHHVVREPHPWQSSQDEISPCPFDGGKRLQTTRCSSTHPFRDAALMRANSPLTW